MNKKHLSGSQLKIIAIIAMVVDHVVKIILVNGFVLQAPHSFFTDSQFEKLLLVNEVGSILGRIAFPIFCFLLVEGFCHTRDVKRYALNLLLLAFLIEPLYDWTLSNQLLFLEGQNVLFTFFQSIINKEEHRLNIYFIFFILCTCYS